MDNVIDAAVGEALKGLMSANGHGKNGIPFLLGCLAKKLPANEAHLAVGADAGCLEETAPHATVLAMASPGERDKGRVLTIQAAIRKHGAARTETKFLEGDFFQLVVKGLPFSTPVGLYYYAGATFQSNLRAAIIRARSFLALKAVVVLDNWNLPSVRAGTWEGVAGLRPSELAFRELPSEMPERPNGFGNGCALFHFSA